MPVSVYEVGAVVVCYALLALLPAGLVRYTLTKEGKRNNRDQILFGVSIYFFVIPAWLLLVEFFDKIYGENIANLYISLVVVLILSFLLLLALKKLAIVR